MYSLTNHLKPLRVSFPILNHVPKATQATASQPQPKHDRDLKPFTSIPGPYKIPFLGSGVSMAASKHFKANRQHNYFRHAVQHYGSIFKIDIFGNDHVFVSEADDIKKVFEATSHNPMRKAAALQSFGLIRERNEYFEGKCGILFEDGEEWWRVRRLAQGPVMKPKIVKSYLDKHNDVTIEFCDLIQKWQEKYGEMPPNFQEEIYKWALESVGLVTLDRRLGCLEPNLAQNSIPMKMIYNVNTMFQTANELETEGLKLWKYFETKTYKKLKSVQEEFADICDQHIRKAVEALEHKNPSDELTLLETLLQIPNLSYKDVLTMILDMLFAGIDTTSNTLGFALYLLSKNPEVQEKVHQEIKEVFGDRTDFQTADFAKLSYTKNVIKETLRLYPIGLGTARVLTDDLELQGYNVPKGYSVITLFLIASRMEKNFKDADKFIPERWGRDRPLGPIHPYASTPFGAGTRMCIGRRIAEQEMLVFLTRIVQRFKVDYKYGEMDINTRIIFCPSEPLKFNFTERK